MIGWFFVTIIVAIIVISIAHSIYWRRERVGTVENIALTFGWGGGHQEITIDGERWAIQLDHSQWPQIGQKIRFKPTVAQPTGYSVNYINILEKL